MDTNTWLEVWPDFVILQVQEARKVMSLQTRLLNGTLNSTSLCLDGLFLLFRTLLTTNRWPVSSWTSFFTLCVIPLLGLSLPVAVNQPQKRPSCGQEEKEHYWLPKRQLAICMKLHWHYFGLHRPDFLLLMKKSLLSQSIGILLPMMNRIQNSKHICKVYTWPMADFGVR